MMAYNRIQATPQTLSNNQLYPMFVVHHCSSFFNVQQPKQISYLNDHQSIEYQVEMPLIYKGKAKQNKCYKAHTHIHDIDPKVLRRFRLDQSNRLVNHIRKNTNKSPGSNKLHASLPVLDSLYLHCFTFFEIYSVQLKLIISNCFDS